MNSTPKGNRKHIGIYGRTNSGKSSLMNTLLGQEISIVSNVEGTTTDPVWKAMELIPFGPIMFIDTAGIDDNSELGERRLDKTIDTIKNIDLGIYVVDGLNPALESFIKIKREFKRFNIPFVLVFNKIDLLSDEELNKLILDNSEALFISVNKKVGIDKLRDKLISILDREEEELPLVGDLVPYGGKVVLVVPIDSEAPKGRLILPQVQCIRDCLDHGIKTIVVRDTELEETIREEKNIDLVITDSQVFKRVDEIVPKGIKLTSFSMLFARQKGDINEFIEGVYSIRNLRPGDNVLISECCSHNVSHEDIGRVKIPKMLEKYVGGKLNFEYLVGNSMPEDIEKYSLVVHCGACMVNRKTVLNRMRICIDKNVKITNYGVLISFIMGILDRTKL